MRLPTTYELHCPGCGARTNFYPFVDNKLPVVCKFCGKIITKTIIKDLITKANMVIKKKNNGKKVQPHSSVL